MNRNSDSSCDSNCDSDSGIGSDSDTDSRIVRLHVAENSLSSGFI